MSAARSSFPSGLSRPLIRLRSIAASVAYSIISTATIISYWHFPYRLSLIRSSACPLSSTEDSKRLTCCPLSSISSARRLTILPSSSNASAIRILFPSSTTMQATLLSCSILYHLIIALGNSCRRCSVVIFYPPSIPLSNFPSINDATTSLPPPCTDTNIIQG